MSAQQYRNEKKFIEEAVAKVRDVVRHASKDDIILALHNYDFDVNKTVQAFCDGAAQSALDSWERTGPGGNKKKNKKKKPKALVNDPISLASAVPKAMNGVSATQPVMNGVKEFENKDRSIAPAHTKSDAGMQVCDNTPNSLSTTLTDTSASNTGNFSKDATGLKNHGVCIQKIEKAFERKISLAEESAAEAFKCVRQILNERENHMLAELRRTHDEGVRFLHERRVRAAELLEREERMSAMSDREQDELRDEIARFVAEMAGEEEVGRITRFVYDNTQLIRLVKNFGEVNSVKAIGGGGASVARQAPSVAVSSAYPIKHSTSHSSIVSSLGEDSGLGQISPVGNDERKSVAEVSNGGISMQSDALTSEQLEEINKRLHESLKEQGIDASVVSGIGSSSTVPLRRRPPPGGRNGGQQRPGKAHPTTRVPNISIFNS